MFLNVVYLHTASGLLSQLAVTINNVTLYCNADVTADSIGNFFNLTMEIEVYCCPGNT